MVEIVNYVLSEHGTKEVLVPANFPISYADLLRKKGLKINWKKNPFFEERTIKTEE